MGCACRLSNVQAIDGFQAAADCQVGQPITVQPGRGWLLVLNQQR
jgi:hypothetical protein